MKPELRKKVEAFIISYVQKVDPSGLNAGMYRKLLKDMDDGALDKLCRSPIPIYAPNGSDVVLDHMKNLDIIRSLGHEPEQFCWLTDPKTGAISKTKYKHLVLPMVYRRQTQLITKKGSFAAHNRTIDTLTGQVAGPSRSSSFSFPQTYVTFTKGNDATIRELLHNRGGDVKAYKVVDRNIRQNGHSSQKFEGSDKTHVKSSVSGGIIFRACHIATNMGGVSQ